MKRFIDIRNQGTGYRFAFWDTCSKCFYEFHGEQVWESFQDFQDAWEEESPQGELLSLERFRNICPEWVFDGEKDDLDSPRGGVEKLES